MNAANSPARARWIGLAVLALVFVAGAVAGAALEHARKPLGGVRPPGIPPFVEELGLDQDQHAKILEIFERHGPEFEAGLKESFKAMEPTIDAIDAEIRLVLTPAQQAQFDSMRQRMREERARHPMLPVPPPIPPGAN
jgi:Spy/CpxP family protein refolding chaperone